MTPHPVPVRRAHRGPLAAAVGACALGALLGGCGLGTDTTPAIVSKRDVPYGLLRPAPPTTVPATAHQFVTIYLVGPHRLVGTSDAVPSPATLGSILSGLGKGPTSAQAAAGLQSPISTAAPLTLVRARRGVATVDLAPSFTRLSEVDQVDAAAQLVFTLTAFPGIHAVAVRIGGDRARIPTGTGTLSGDPLMRSDYASVGPI